LLEKMTEEVPPTDQLSNFRFAAKSLSVGQCVKQLDRESPNPSTQLRNLRLVQLPDGSVTGRAKAALVNVCRVGKQICQPGNKSRRQVFIK